jgi:CRP/FNR family transcriptional regulator
VTVSEPTPPGMTPTSAQKARCSGGACRQCASRLQSICSVLEPSSELPVLESILTRISASSREVIFYEGDPANHLFNVTGGLVKIYKELPDGRRQITGFLHPGDFLGLATRDRYSFSAEAVTDATLCRFPRGEIEKLLERFPRFERRLLETACNELESAQERMLILGRKTAIEKIASFFLALAERTPRESDVVTLTMSRADIADYLGLTTETVSRTVTTLKSRNLIRLLSGNRISIPDRAALEDVLDSG